MKETQGDVLLKNGYIKSPIIVPSKEYNIFQKNYLSIFDISVKLECQCTITSQKISPIFRRACL